MRPGLALAACATIALAMPAARAADPSPEQLRSIETSIRQSEAHEAELARKAAQLQAETEDLRQRAIAAAAAAQQHEASMNALEDRITEFAEREAEALASLDRRRRQLAVLIGALERIARHPPVALIALPAPPSDTVRSALLLRTAVPQVEAQAKSLRHAIEELSELRNGLAAARAGLEAEQQALDEQNQTLAALIVDKERLAGKTEAERAATRARGEKLASEARDLRDLLARLTESRNREAARRAAEAKAKASTSAVASLPPAAKPPAQATGRLPVIGRIAQNFGEPDQFGQTARGMSVNARPGSPVVAPQSGTVVFAGPFQGLGRLLIIEHGGEYHLLLAGLSRIDPAVGDPVVAGEPVGSMDASEDAKPTLYMELRLKGRPVNPLPWLAAGRTRVNG